MTEKKRGRGGAKPGERRGGRKRGTPNKATLRRMEHAEAKVREALQSGKKLPKEILYDFAVLFAGMASVFQPTHPDQPPNPNVNEDKFWKATDYCLEFAKAAANYYSPTLRALAVHGQPGQGGMMVVHDDGPLIDLTEYTDDELQLLHKTFARIAGGDGPGGPDVSGHGGGTTEAAAPPSTRNP